jgi:hypothetical protein
VALTKRLFEDSGDPCMLLGIHCSAWICFICFNTIHSLHQLG